MKALMTLAVAGLLIPAGLLLAQNAAPGAGAVQGRGRGGAPYAWNDKDKDGICDLTNRPAGQGQGAGFRRGGGRGWGRGAGAAWGRRGGRGWGRAAAAQQQPPATPAPK